MPYSKLGQHFAMQRAHKTGRGDKGRVWTEVHSTTRPWASFQGPSEAAAKTVAKIITMPPGSGTAEKMFPVAGSGFVFVCMCVCVCTKLLQNHPGSRKEYEIDAQF